MTKAVFVTIIGRTNAGKSSLLNSMIGEKIASVSAKSQTTRTRITGIKTIDNVQMVFMDTPGLHKPKNKLSDHMLGVVKESVADIDTVIFMADCTKTLNDSEEKMLKNIIAGKTPVIFVLNKIDLLEKKSDLIPIIAEISRKFDPEAIIPVSVKENNGINLIEQEVMKLAAESPHFFPDDMITDQPEKVIAGEIIREKLLNLLNDEIPHGIAVTVETMKERSDKDILDIDAVIYCEKESHKGIVIGKGGYMLKKAATLSREDLEKFFRIKVNLKCWVKVKEDWRNKDGIIRSFGLAEK